MFNKTKTIKPLKRYQPTRGEVAKTVIIAVLVTGIVSFVAGNLYATGQQERLEQAATSATLKK